MREVSRKAKGRVSTEESHRLIESLQTAGWPLRWIETRGELPDRYLGRLLRQASMSIERRNDIRNVFLLLRDQQPPQDTHEEKIAVSTARLHGERNGGVLPEAIKIGVTDARHDRSDA